MTQHCLKYTINNTPDCLKYKMNAKIKRCFRPGRHYYLAISPAVEKHKKKKRRSDRRKHSENYVSVSFT